jgi:uncharacterized damage-inducible protein DinB
MDWFLFSQNNRRTMEKWFDKKFELGLDDSQFKDLLNKLSETPTKIENLIKNIPEEILNTKPDGKWSIKENIGHLIDLEELHSDRIDDFIEGKEILRSADLQNKKTDEANHNNTSTDKLLTELKKARKYFISRFKALDKEVLNRKAIHPRLNQDMRPVDMAYFVAEHDAHHISTVQELIGKISS